MEFKSEGGDGLEKYIKHIRSILGNQTKLYCIRAHNAKEFTVGTFAKIVMDEKAETDFSAHTHQN